MTTLSAGNDHLGITVATTIDHPVDAWIGADRDRVELRGRVRARLPGQRDAPRRAAPAPARRALVAPGRPAGPVAGERCGSPATRCVPDRADGAPSATPERAVSPRDARSPGGPRPLLPAVAARSVDRPRPGEPSAAPFHDWNQRVAAECYRPNAERGNLGRISWNLGPTLAVVAGRRGPARPTHRFVARQRPGDRPALPPHDPAARVGGRPRTEIAWGIRDFELRFGRRPAGIWLPETAVDRATLREAARQGIAFTVLAPWQAAESGDRHPPTVPRRAR